MLIFPDLFSYLLVFRGLTRQCSTDVVQTTISPEACILQADLGWLGCSLDLNLLDVFSWVHPNSPSCLTECLVFIMFYWLFFILWPSIANQLPHCDSLAQWNEHTKFLRKSHLKYLKATRELPQHWRCIFCDFSLYKIYFSRQLNWNHEVGNIFKSTIRGPWSRPEGWTLHDSNWMSSANAVCYKHLWYVWTFHDVSTPFFCSHFQGVFVVVELPALRLPCKLHYNLYISQYRYNIIYIYTWHVRQHRKRGNPGFIKT